MAFIGAEFLPDLADLAVLETAGTGIEELGVWVGKGINFLADLCRRFLDFMFMILEKVGLNRVVPVFDTDEDAVAQLGSQGSSPAVDDESAFEEDASSVLFSLTDKERLQHFIETVRADNPVHGHAFGGNWSGVGRMSNLSADGLAFTWGGGGTNLTPFEMGQMLGLGTPLAVKFRMPLLQRGYCKALVEVQQLEERADGVKLSCRFKDIDADTLKAVAQYSQDMELLRDELGATVDDGGSAD